MHSRWLETLQFWIGRQILFGTTSWRRTFESLRVAFPHVSHRFTLVLAFLGSLLVAWWCLVLFVVGCVLCLFCFGRLPTLSRCRSFLPDLMTVRAVMVRAALEKKKHQRWQGGVRTPPRRRHSPSSLSGNFSPSHRPWGGFNVPSLPAP